MTGFFVETRLTVNLIVSLSFSGEYVYLARELDEQRPLVVTLLSMGPPPCLQTLSKFVAPWSMTFLTKANIEAWSVMVP